MWKIKEKETWRLTGLVFNTSCSAGEEKGGWEGGRSSSVSWSRSGTGSWSRSGEFPRVGEGVGDRLRRASSNVFKNC